jgi:hypothetical protein
MEAFAPGAVVVDVARRADVSATLPSKDSEADSAFTWIGKLKFDFAMA